MLENGTLLLLLIPVGIIQFALMIYCLINVIKKQETKYLNRIAWVLIIALVNLFGPIVYLIMEGAHDGGD